MTRNARWLDAGELQQLADCAAAYAAGRVTPAEFTQRPGLEPVWVFWLADLGVVTVTDHDLTLIAPSSPPPRPQLTPGREIPQP